MISVDIKVTLDEATPKLTSMKGRGTNFRPVFWIAREELAKANAKNFTTSGLPVGGWDPRTRDYAWPLMRRTGRLFQSLTTLQGAPNEINRMNATFGTDVEYAKFHQSGTRKMAKRQVVFEPAGFGEKMARIAGKYYVDGVLP
jgi:phage gpG-like protein